MAKTDGVFLYVGTYPDRADAEADYRVIKDVHLAGAIGSYDAAVITKDARGRVHVNKDEMATRHGAWGGIAVGALVGILFPPSIIGSAILGGVVGGVGGHLWRGLSRGDVKELGEVIDDGEAALVVIGETKIASALQKAQLKAAKHVEKQLDVDPKALHQEVQEASGDLSSSKS
jgi:uncharacterized membrane protein